MKRYFISHPIQVKTDLDDSRYDYRVASVYDTEDSGSYKDGVLKIFVSIDDHDLMKCGETHRIMIYKIPGEGSRSQPRPLEVHDVIWERELKYEEI